MSNKAYYQKQIIDLRARIAREKESMKRDNESYARMVKSASSPSSKADYRKAKAYRYSGSCGTLLWISKE